MLLCIHPEMQEKMFDEIQNVVGTERFPTYRDRHEYIAKIITKRMEALIIFCFRLLYTEAFITEVNRYRCPANTTVPHECEQETYFRVSFI